MTMNNRVTPINRRNIPTTNKNGVGVQIIHEKPRPNSNNKPNGNKK
jgi:hypothetical protein